MGDEGAPIDMFGPPGPDGRIIVAPPDFGAIPVDEDEEFEDHTQVDAQQDEYGGEYGEGELYEVFSERSVAARRPTIRIRYPSEYEQPFPEGFGEGGQYFFYYGEGAEVAPEIAPYTPSRTPSIVSVASVETEEEKALRMLKEMKIEELKAKIADRQILRRRNLFLQKKLVEHYKKRRMDHVLQDESKGLDQDTKYLRRLYAFQDYKRTQEECIAELKVKMAEYKKETDQVQEELQATLEKFLLRQKEVSGPLILTKTGKKINDKLIERLVRRQQLKNEEIGQARLKYIKIKNLIEEKEAHVRGLEHLPGGLHMMDYEQMKVDMQNYSDKLEEKEDELVKIRMKAKSCILNLANVREKAYAIEGDIELTEGKCYEVEKMFIETRSKLTYSKKKRDNLRTECFDLKEQSGLLTNNLLLRDFESSIDQAEELSIYLDELKKASSDKDRLLRNLEKMRTQRLSSYLDFKFPFELSGWLEKKEQLDREMREKSKEKKLGFKKKKKKMEEGD